MQTGACNIQHFMLEYTLR